MDNADVQKKCDELLKSLGAPGFLLFGWQKSDKKYSFVYSYRRFPKAIVIKGLVWALAKLTNSPTKGNLSS